MTTYAELDEQRAGFIWAMDREDDYVCLHCREDIDLEMESHDPADGAWWVHVDTGKRECR